MMMKKMKVQDVFNNKFDLIFYLNNKMDFFILLIELNNKIELNKLAKETYEIDSDDEEEEIEYILKLRKNLINQYNKINNRQFKLIKTEKFRPLSSV